MENVWPTNQSAPLFVLWTMTQSVELVWVEMLEHFQMNVLLHRTIVRIKTIVSIFTCFQARPFQLIKLFYQNSRSVIKENATSAPKLSVIRLVNLSVLKIVKTSYKHLETLVNCNNTTATIATTVSALTICREASNQMQLFNLL